ncbi:MAG: hypothetical protein K0Q51_496 [Rickettsiaceae bacterium]|jgi:hypothetical protein|nr:hypothetical protein [Rickettsiaceae bacterium]
MEQQPNQPQPTTSNLTTTVENRIGSILGIISIVFGAASFFPFLGFMSIIGLITGIVGIIKKEYTKNIVGLALSFVGLISSPLLISAIYCFFTNCGIPVLTDKEKNINGTPVATYNLDKPNISNKGENSASAQGLYEVINKETSVKMINEYYIFIGKELASTNNLNSYVKDISKRICEGSKDRGCRVYSFLKININDFSQLTDEIKEEANGTYKQSVDGSHSFSFRAISISFNGNEDVRTNPNWSILAPNVYYIGGKVLQLNAVEQYIYLSNRLYNDPNRHAQLSKIGEDLCTQYQDVVKCTLYFWTDKTRVPTINPVNERDKNTAIGQYSLEGRIKNLVIQ